MHHSPTPRMVARAATLFKTAAIALVIGPIACFSAAHAAGAPSYAKQPVVVEYDVDPSWPQYPPEVSQKGWVSGMAIDAKEQIWFFKKGPDPVQVYTTDGRFVRTWGKGRFVDPHHLRIDPDGNIWLVDFGRHVVEKFTPEGKLLMTLGTPGKSGEDQSHFNRPTDVVVTPAGDIFVTDGYGNRRVVHFDKHGRFVKAWGEYGSGPGGQFVVPHAIVVDSRGRLYVADRNSGRIQVFTQEGRFVEQWTNVIMPWGLSITPDDQLWVCGSTPHWWYRHGKYQEYKDQILMRFSTDGRVRQVWGLKLGKSKDALKPGETIGVHCIVQDSQGNLYIGDIYGERAQKLIPVTKR
ncbi:MAG: hypothetical protein GXP27_06200 [Planctomycetes bacterium]|nr:hypothetical protein [Planctomycetota bacterium]